MDVKTKKKLARIFIAAVILAGATIMAWLEFRPSGLGDGFASANGRIEATEVDVASKLAGRLVDILVDEGDFVEAGQTLARMDTQVLEAQLSQAQAEVRKAENAIRTANSQVALRVSEKATAEAVVRQRQAELVAAEKRHQRTETLVARNAMARQQLDDDLAAYQSAQAAVSAAHSQVLSALAGIEAAQSQVIEAESALEAEQANVERLQADIEDSQLKAPRAGRVQYRISQPGEVLAAGGRILNLVDLNDVYMNVFLPSQQAGRVALGSDVRLILDAAPQFVIPAKVTFVASVAQFTPKTVETASEREKLMFRVKARIDPQLLKDHLEQVKTGVPGMAYLKLDADAEWPEALHVRIEQ